MTVACQRQEPPASPELIHRLEQRLGRPLPAAYRDYLLQQDGGRLDNNDQAVNTIFGLGDVPPWASMWSKLDTYHDRVPAWLLPVAYDDGGNLYALSLREQDQGTIWFWDHENEADEDEPPTETNIELVARTWPDFLTSLQAIEP